MPQRWHNSIIKCIAILDYKPIGWSGGGWADYNKYPFLILPFDVVDTYFLEEIKTLHGTKLYFYSDSTSPKYPKNIYPYIKKVVEVFKKNEDFVNEIRQLIFEVERRLTTNQIIHSEIRGIVNDEE